ncbi:CinA family protein [uncultured Helicobacter sp.]|uniref:CinA family protein n=1 Tax=uncultured Helicobacter sp. TaxID=175537 RepID=UPI00374EA29B
MKHTISFLLIGIDSVSAITLLQSFTQKSGISLESQGFFVKATHSHKATLEAFVREVNAFFGAKFVLSKSLAQTAITLLKSTHQKLSTAESCTGGLLGYEFTQISGASEVFLGGVISYDNSIKESWLGVDSQDLQSFGAVSEVVVSQMCKGILHLSGADFALATSGIAGPGGGSAQKPVGLVYIGVQHRGEVAKVERHIFSGNRKSVQKQAAQTAILMLIREILES